MSLVGRYGIHPVGPLLAKESKPTQDLHAGKPLLQVRATGSVSPSDAPMRGNAIHSIRPVENAITRKS